MSLELELVRAYRRYLEHLSGKHNQKSHGNKYGSTAAIKANVKRLGGDKAALKSMAKKARGDEKLQSDVKRKAKAKKAIRDFRARKAGKVNTGGIQVLTFSPYANNVLDFVGNDKLATKSGDPVKITRARGGSGGFDITIGKKLVGENLGNIEASYILNTNEVGVTK